MLQDIMVLRELAIAILRAGEGRFELWVTLEKYARPFFPNGRESPFAINSSVAIARS